jgi:serine/threonine protein kinase
MSDAQDALLSALGERYELLDVLGVGGMGTVYLAHDPKHDRQVAIKTIHPELLSDDGIKRFEREIQVTARLQHAHILPLLDSGVAAGVPYYVMPHVVGESLHERLEREKQLPIEEAVQIAREVADALGYAHGLDIIHRDIKPGNIMLSGGHAFVTDFGIARAITKAGGGSLTSTGVSIGTPLYMSPEQATDAKECDGRSDIYSLACVLYQMLAGQTPFTGPTAESILRQHLSIEPPLITNYRTTVPADVASVLAQALAKSPADRLSPAARFGEALTLSALTQVSAESAAQASIRSRRVRNALLLVVSIYLAGSWGVLTLVESVSESAGLPTWVSPLAILLLLLGLPMVITTAFVQAGTNGGPTSDPGPLTPTSIRTAATLRPEPVSRSLFTWRNAIGGGVLALALWGLVAAGWMVWFRGGETSLAGVGPGAEPAGATQDSGAVALAEGDSTQTATGAQDSEAPDSGEPSEGTAVDSRPAPPPPPPTTSSSRETEQTRSAYTVEMGVATAAREAADESGARSLQPRLTATADSLWEEATRAASSGRYRSASGLIAQAGDAYDRTRTAAVGIWRRRLDSARTATGALRAEADPDIAAYETAEGLRREALRAEGESDYAAALSFFQDAATAFIAARPEEPGPDATDPPAGEVVDGPAAPPPVERIQLVVSELRAAIEQEDVARLQGVWVSLTSGQLGGFQSLFDDGRDIRVTIDVDEGSITEVGDRVSARVTMTYEYFNEGTGRSERPAAFQQQLQIGLRNGRWVIVGG